MKNIRSRSYQKWRIRILIRIFFSFGYPRIRTQIRISGTSVDRMSKQAFHQCFSNWKVYLHKCISKWDEYFFRVWDKRWRLNRYILRNFILGLIHILLTFIFQLNNLIFFYFVKMILNVINCLSLTEIDLMRECFFISHNENNTTVIKIKEFQVIFFTYPRNKF